MHTAVACPEVIAAVSATELLSFKLAAGRPVRFPSRSGFQGAHACVMANLQTIWATSMSLMLTDWQMFS